MTVRLIARHQYDDERDEIERELTDIHCLDESLTIQDADDDMKILMTRFGLNDGSQLPTNLGLGPIDPSYYGDFTEKVDLRTALDRSRELNATFMALPADVRARVDNDPLKLLTFVHNPKNRREAEELGLITPKAPEPILEPKKATEPAT